MEEKSDEKKEGEEDIGKKEGFQHNKILKRVFLVFAIVVVLVAFSFVFINSVRNFEYKGITGNVVKEGELIFYRTSLPVMHEGKETEYNFYIRNDPRKLDIIPFNGELITLKGISINISEEFNCDGDGIIGLANLINLYEVIGSTIIIDEEAGCDEESRYMYLDVKQGDKTYIERVGPACYDLYVNNCEVLKVTERFMVETLVKANQVLS